jgi:hypothetical protein
MFGKSHSMKYPSRMMSVIEKVQLKIAALILVLAGPAIAGLVSIQIWRGAISAKGGSVTIESDPVTFYALNGMLALVGCFALMVSALTAQHLLRRMRNKRGV